MRPCHVLGCVQVHDMMSSSACCEQPVPMLTKHPMQLHQQVCMAGQHGASAPQPTHSNTDRSSTPRSEYLSSWSFDQLE
eukprot:CAMPEP_0202859010 /NCGR_PEP_ID=MMETSP1391-20130828/1314_1 /ASSEMBLY_ACC=CAM_ASM_000867 /TAXON_ID=1034604 /ORGANISM="Chlamydomonas leiostraca, Strain SAG 11-49" /LENGTH=78 /DNA_ID=CAMNT_0049538007 /DNA_START=65 /DNA_END=298 /DNA_ORIENTATION=-